MEDDRDWDIFACFMGLKKDRNDQLARRIKRRCLPQNREGQRGPTFLSEPPNKVDFQNDTGIIVPCSAQGHPAPMISWTQQDGNPLRDVVGVRHTRPDGSLVFPPFAAEDYRQGVHDAVYRCVATNIVGSIISREVHVKAGKSECHQNLIYKTSSFIYSSYIDVDRHVNKYNSYGDEMRFIHTI
ncbi:Down syndrome cell adhesion molecule-like protein Dscam2 [Araneus ventricosus]|uniref:Down syndrome cell adhesion molecule-like protein Dscam2 n=1 Tax=Araneus ventricosus TaxID=182803 RepID=A0A4Y2EG31_ARAVE|nr:Down syndrome cell adhesion molecule-like protein Dscam2 [Araneus ventricosus]